MDPNQEIETGKPQEINKPLEAGRKNILAPFKKIETRVRKTVSRITQAFANLKDQSRQINFDPEDHELEEQEKQLDKLNQKTEKALGVKNVDAMEKISERLGTNPGGIFRDRKTGKKLYIKQYEDPEQAGCEFIANQIYKLLGAPVLNGILLDKESSPAYATEYQPDFRDLPKERRNEAKKFFVAIAYLADWDAVGTGPEHPYGNLQVNDKGELILIDHGGSLLFRGLQGRKDLKKLVSHDIPEINSMRSNLNPLSKAIFGDITEDEISSQVKTLVEKLDDNRIREIVEEAGLSISTQKTVLNLLIGRRKALESKYGIRVDSNIPEQEKTHTLEGIERTTQKLKELGQMKDKEIFPTVGMSGDGDKIEVLPNSNEAKQFPKAVPNHEATINLAQINKETGGFARPFHPEDNYEWYVLHERLMSTSSPGRSAKPLLDHIHTISSEQDMEETLQNLGDFGHSVTPEESNDGLSRIIDYAIDLARKENIDGQSLDLRKEELYARIKAADYRLDLPGKLTQAQKRWEQHYRERESNQYLQDLAKLAESNTTYVEGVHALLHKRYPSGYIKVYRGGGAAGEWNRDPLARKFMNVTSDRAKAINFQATNNAVDLQQKALGNLKPVIDGVIVRIEDILALGSIKESELIIPSEALRRATLEQ